MKKKFLLLLSVVFVFCSVASVAVADDSCEHKYVYSKIDDGYVVYTCEKCQKQTYKHIEVVVDLAERAQYNVADDNSFVDLVPDGFVNAKDYAKIRNEYKKFKREPGLDIGGTF